jgi:nucleoside-diphosphate kinase
MIEKSLVLMKPDAVKRGIVGEILQRFERMGLKIVGMKMLHPERAFVEKHYSTSDENLIVMGNKTLEDAKENKVDLMATLGTVDPLVIGKNIWGWSVDFLSSGPIIAMVLEGPHAIANIRAQVGHTLPLKSAPGTIRGDYGLDSSFSGNSRNRTIYNLVHASGNKVEAELEINLWFKPEEILPYKRVHEDLYGY